jgi:hypothetical protein
MGMLRYGPKPYAHHQVYGCSCIQYGRHPCFISSQQDLYSSSLIVVIDLIIVAVISLSNTSKHAYSTKGQMASKHKKCENLIFILLGTNTHSGFLGGIMGIAC